MVLPLPPAKQRNKQTILGVAAAADQAEGVEMDRMGLGQDWDEEVLLLLPQKIWQLLDTRLLSCASR